MFEEINELVDELRNRTNSVAVALKPLAGYFHALGLVECYDKLIEYADERTQEHPEVQRVPELRLLLIAHLLENVDRHIDIGTDRIFNPIILGGPKSLRDWQEAGWHTKRTASNYARRLAYWKAIYDEAPLIYQKRIPAPEDIFSLSYTKISKLSSRRIERRQKTLEGSVNRIKVHYADVIHARIANYSASQSLVPWWEVLNYGSVYGGVAGYPNTPGLHFVEDAERLVPATLSRYAEIFVEILADIFDKPFTSSNFDIISVVERQAKAHLPTTKYLPADDVARILAFGVPF